MPQAAGGKEVVEGADELPNPARDPIPSHALETILLGLKALPKRMALAISNCFALLTVVTVFWLAMLIVPYEPKNANYT